MNANVIKKRAGVFAMLALALPGLALAQNAPPPPPPDGGIGFLAFGTAPGPEAGQAVAFLGFEGGIGGKTVAGAPFSATFTTQSTQTLADGNQIQRSTSGTLNRDSQGRTRRDLTLPGIGPWAPEGKAAPHVVMINDVVADKQFILEPDRKIAHQVGVLPGGRRHGQGRRFGAGGPPPGGPPPDDNAKNVVTTSLGTQTVNGVVAEGTRYTRTIPAGAIGNQNPIVITTERWYSPDLQMVVLSKRNDPRSGETITQLTNIQRGEPDASLFQVPSDYTVQQGGLGPKAAVRTGGRLEQ